MKASKFTEAQIAFVLQQAEDGTPVAEVCRKAGISDATFYNWRKKYAGVMPSEMKRLRQIEEENAKLKRIVADLSLDKAMLQDVLSKKLCGLAANANLSTNCTATGRYRPAAPARPAGSIEHLTFTSQSAATRLISNSGSRASARRGCVTDIVASTSCYAVTDGWSTQSAFVGFTGSQACNCATKLQGGV
jgi:putative transposase